MEHENSSQCSQQPAICPYPEPQKSSSFLPNPVYLRPILILPFPPTLKAADWSLSAGFRQCYMRRPSHTPWPDLPSNIRWAISFITLFSPPSSYWAPLGPKSPPWHLTTEHPQPTLFVSITDQVSHPQNKRQSYVLGASIPNITNSSCQQVTTRWVSNTHTVLFTCAPLCLIPTWVAKNIKSVTRQYTQPRHWIRSGEGAIVWAPHGGVALVCGLPEESGRTGQLDPSASLSPGAHKTGTTCLSHSPKARNQNINHSIQTSLTESDRQWHCTMFSPNWMTKCLTRVSIWRQVFVPCIMTLVTALKKKNSFQMGRTVWAKLHHLG